jgi:hypothetical protein
VPTLGAGGFTTVLIILPEDEGDEEDEEDEEDELDLLIRLNLVFTSGLAFRVDDAGDLTCTLGCTGT